MLRSSFHTSSIDSRNYVFHLAVHRPDTLYNAVRPSASHFHPLISNFLQLRLNKKTLILNNNQINNNNCAYQYETQQHQAEDHHTAAHLVCLQVSDHANHNTTLQTK